MARIRSVHPGLFTDEAFAQLTDAAQIFWIGLWTEADDQGVFEWKPITLKMRLRPASTAPVEPLLAELLDLDCIKQYSSNGKKYGAIRNFCKYQRPKKPNSIHPMPPELRTYVRLSDLSSEPDVVNDGSSSPLDEVKRDVIPPKVEISNQMEDGGGRREEKEEPSSLRSDERLAAAPPKPDAPPAPVSQVMHLQPPEEIDAKTRLFREGLPALMRIAQASRDQSGKLVGKWCKQNHNDYEGLLDIIREAEAKEVFDPVAWIAAAVKARTDATPLEAADDPWGVKAWIRKQKITEVGNDDEGNPHPCINGHMVDVTLEMVATAARFPQSWRGNWDAAAAWMQDDIGIGQFGLQAITDQAFRMRREGQTISSIAVFDSVVRRHNSLVAA